MWHQPGVLTTLGGIEDDAVCIVGGVERIQVMSQHENRPRGLPPASARKVLRIGVLDGKLGSRPSVVEPDAVSWLAWLEAKHGAGLKISHVKEPIALRAISFYARRGIHIAVGTQITPAFVAGCIDALERAGVEKDLVADLREHYGVGPVRETSLRGGTAADVSEPTDEVHVPDSSPAQDTTRPRDHSDDTVGAGAPVTSDTLLAEVIGYVPEHLRGRPGALLYTGRDALTDPAPIYLLGVNPGGDPVIEPQTVVEHATKVLTLEPSDFSAYRDERWGGGAMAPGAHKMQRNVLHLMRKLDLEPGKVPASNLVFIRSSREADIDRRQMQRLAEECWPLHNALIERLGTRAIVCFGSTAAEFVRRKLGANTQIGEFTEKNNRRWTSRAFRNADGIVVVQVTHPSIASWLNPASDVSPLVASAVALAE